MHLEGKSVVASPREKVWAFLSTPESVVLCIPGLQEHRIEPGKKIVAKMKIGVGFIKGNFNVTTRVLEEDPVKYHARLGVDGSGAASAFNADINIDLNSVEKGTEIVWSAEAKVSGPLGGIAKGLIEDQASKMITQIMDCITKQTS
jgi:carbon monoxide dehydrogenase subunit G